MQFQLPNPEPGLERFIDIIVAWPFATLWPATASPSFLGTISAPKSRLSFPSPGPRETSFSTFALRPKRFLAPGIIQSTRRHFRCRDFCTQRVEIILSPFSSNPQRILAKGTRKSNLHSKVPKVDLYRRSQSQTGTGRGLSFTDENCLRLLLSRSCGWSPTYPEHTRDESVNFFNLRCPQLKGLVPILDSRTYKEELEYFPDGFRFQTPQFFLLVRSDCYYIFDATDGQDCLRIAGKTLREVYTGLRGWRWADSSEDPWCSVGEIEWLESWNYFSTYSYKSTGNLGSGEGRN